MSVSDLSISAAMCLLTPGSIAGSFKVGGIIRPGGGGTLRLANDML